MNRIDQLETVIEEGRQTFADVGNALAEIRDAKLYREVYPTFEEYCRARWGMSRIHSYRQIAAAKIAEMLPTGNTTESHIRPLTRLDSTDEQREAWKIANDLAESESVSLTAEHVENGVQAIQLSKVASVDPDAIMSIAKGIRHARAEDKRKARELRAKQAESRMMSRRETLMADHPQKFMQANDDVLSVEVIEYEDQGDEREGVLEFVRQMAHLYMDDAIAPGVIFLRILFPQWTYDEIALHMNTSKRSVIRRLELMERNHNAMYEFARSRSRIGGARDV